MADSRKTYTVTNDEVGTVIVVDEVVASIAALAATEVKGVYSMAGTLSNQIKDYIGMHNLAKGVKVELVDDEFVIDVAIKLDYGYNVMDVSNKVQEKVKSTVENMTGMTVSDVNVKIADVYVENKD